MPVAGDGETEGQHLLGKSLDLVPVIAIRVCTIITKRWLAGLHKKMSTSHLHSGVSSEKVTLHTIKSLIYFCLPFSSIKTPNNADPTKTRRFQEALKSFCPRLSVLEANNEKIKMMCSNKQR